MFINISFRDKIIIFVFSLLLLGAVFVFAILKPVTADTEVLKKQRDQKKEVWTNYETKINRLPGLQKEVAEKVDEATVLAERFTPVPKDLTKVDDMIMEVIKKHNMNAGFSATHPSPIAIPYSYDQITVAQNSEDLVTYDLKQAADLDGSVAKRMAEANQYGLSVAALPATTVLGTTLTFTCEGTREEIYGLIDELAEMGESSAKAAEGKLDGTIRVTSISLGDYNFNLTAEDEEKRGITTCSFNIVVYHVEPLHFDPDLLPE
ncbi:MAG: hypothetical protein LBM93_00075 [Oscillospiraceae bacterium]|jgi:hypothetical protein|nr:hypothetical protein [Oscillospiraceae bacterium]